MNPGERWLRVEELFHRALDCPAEERSSRLEEWCGGDRALRDEVESLIAAAEAADKDTEASHPGEQGPRSDPWIGRTVGAFRLERLIGRGGMGAVYFGRRVTGDFDQEIAFKLISTRLTSDELRQRFLMERRALASLNHPHIARLIDGGVTGDGEPYLVMEYIEGATLDRYCEETSASVGEIVRLFLQLCDAVAFVHRNLILHRDLKPANVLVTKEGRLKLLDFGAAKLLEAEAGSEVTRTGMRPFTPRYASPEQVLGETVTAASDVYSLGVVLYRLLTGRLPFDSDRLSRAQFLDTVFEIAPVAPHEAITRTGAEAKPIPDASARRAQVRGDLDAIVLKALQPDPKQRYASVDALAGDLGNYLEHRPVSARPRSLGYRVAKFVRRHALAAGAAAAAALALGIGVAATLREARIAALEEVHATNGLHQIHRLANLLLFDFYEEVSKLAGSTDVQRRLVAQALGYLDALSSQAAGDPDIQLDLVEAYTKMGNVLGNPYEANLGDAPKALASLGKALRLAEEVQRRRPGDPRAIRRLDVARRSLGEVHFSAGNTARAIEHSRAAADSFEGLALRSNPELADVYEAASTFDSLGDMYGLHGSASTGDLGAARESYRHALAMHQRALQIKPNNVRSLRGLAIALMKIANTQADAEPPAAARGYAEALAVLDRLPPAARQAMPTPRIGAVIRHKLGQIENELGNPKAAVPYLESSRNLYASLAARDAEDTRTRFDLTTVDYDLAGVSKDLGDLPGARAEYRRVVQVLDDLLRRDPGNLVWAGHRAEATYELGRIDRALGRAEEGERAVREGLTAAVSVAANPDASTGDLARAADYLIAVEPARWRDPEKSLEFATRAVERSRGTNAGYLVTLSDAQKACGKAAAARQTLEKALALLPPSVPGQPASRLRRRVEKSLADLNRAAR